MLGLFGMSYGLEWVCLVYLMGWVVWRVQWVGTDVYIGCGSSLRVNWAVDNLWIDHRYKVCYNLYGRPIKSYNS